MFKNKKVELFQLFQLCQLFQNLTLPIYILELLKETFYFFIQDAPRAYVPSPHQLQFQSHALLQQVYALPIVNSALSVT